MPVGRTRKDRRAGGCQSDVAVIASDKSQGDGADCKTRAAVAFRMFTEHNHGDGAHGKRQSDGKPKLKRKQYEKELRRLQAELCHLQQWVKPRACGSSSCSKDVTALGRAVPSKRSQSVSALACFASSLSPPRRTARSRRCISSVTSSIFLRRARSYLRPQLVQPRWRGVCHGVLYERRAPPLPRGLPGGGKIRQGRGIQLIKYWLEVSNDEQKRRFEARINDPLRSGN